MKRLLPLLLLVGCEMPSAEAPAPHRPTLPTRPSSPPVASPPRQGATPKPPPTPSSPTAEPPRDTAESAPPPPGTAATVASITDGDTFRARIGKKNERVRLIGIDTPETRNSPRGPQPYADEATDALKTLLGRGRVRLVFDAEERDHYGRLLAYVYASDGTFVNEAMLRAGWAKALRVPPNVAQAKNFERLEREARRKGKGIWAR